MVKSTHPGNAARMSTEAALLARRGFRSHDAIFESPRGYVSVLFDDRFDWDGWSCFRFALSQACMPYSCLLL